MEKTWLHDAAAYLIVFVWMLLTFATIQQRGASIALLGSAAVVLITGLLLIYNQRIAYLRLGDKVVLGTRDMTGISDDSEEQVEEWREENR
jgi:hypothetical protein